MVSSRFFWRIGVALGLIVGTGAVVFGYTGSGAGMQAGEDFKDVAEHHPYAETIGDLKELGFVKGYGDGTFKPDQSVSRAEFITMVMAGLKIPVNSDECFSDVHKNDWFSPYVCTAKVKQYIAGYADGTFRPHRNINFAEASMILSKAYRLRPPRPKASEPWYKPAVSRLEARAAIPVSVDEFSQKITRGETGEIILRLAEKLEDRPTQSYASLAAPLPTIASCEALTEKFRVAYYRQNRSLNRYLMKESFAMPTAVPPGAGGDFAAKDSVAPQPAEGEISETVTPREYSSTNVQVEGVDEPDIVKNDGSYIYFVSRRNVRVVLAYPPAEMREVAVAQFNDEHFSPNDLYITENKLIVTGATWTKGEFGTTRTKLYVYAMNEARSLTEERVLEFDGVPISSRSIGNRVYLVMNDSPNIYRIMEQSIPVEEELPHYLDSKTDAESLMVPCGDIRYIPHYDHVSYTIVASVDVSNPQSTVDKEVIVGAAETVYSSLTNLYVAAAKYEYPEYQTFDVWSSPAGQKNTTIFRFKLESNGEMSFHGKGEVPGRLLNQFALDESIDDQGVGTLRVATTIGEVWDTRKPSTNSLYILDRENMGTVVGKIENIAPGEKIYSVRFIGGRAYMVTFKKIDPFFVIDVSNASAPKILGELKIPGYSDYLHPFDENHIIGFGKEAVDPVEVERAGLGGRGFDFAWYQGMKIALFDVTDVGNPKVLFKEVIGDRGTESELLRNHRALLFDKARGLFAFPVSVAQVKSRELFPGQDPASAYGEPVFQGAYVYKLDLQNGFQLQGRVTHMPAGQQYFLDDRYEIHRIIFIGDHLYTISHGMLKAVARDGMAETKVLDLGLTNDTPRFWILE